MEANINRIGEALSTPIFSHVLAYSPWPLTIAISESLQSAATIVITPVKTEVRRGRET